MKPILLLSSILIIISIVLTSCQNKQDVNADGHRLPEYLNDEYVDLLAREIHIEKFPDSVNMEFIKETSELRISLMKKIEKYREKYQPKRAPNSNNPSDKIKSEMKCNSSYNENLVRERFENLSKDIYGISLAHTNKYGPGECEFVFLVNGYDNTKNRGYTCTVKTGSGKIIEASCELTKY